MTKLKHTPLEETTTQAVMLLIKASLGNNDLNCRACLDAPIDWDRVYHLAAAQGVLAIVWDGIAELHRVGIMDTTRVIPRELRLKWALSVENIEKRYMKQRSALAHLSHILAEHDIRVAPLKGYGLSLCYPIPEHRACSDIDIWLFGEQKRADDILRSKYNIAIDEDKHHHTVFYLDGVMVENHYDFLNIASHYSSRSIESYLKEEATRSTEVLTVDGATIYLPSVDCHALFLLRHAASHFAAIGIVLRHVIDWGLFVKRHHKDINWDRLRSICREQNMEEFLDAMSAMASEICNMNLSLIPGTQRRISLERRILCDILEPEFSTKRPDKGTIRIITFKLRRWWANRWKHRLVYRDTLVSSFITQTWSHIRKPKGMKA